MNGRLYCSEENDLNLRRIGAAQVYQAGSEQVAGFAVCRMGGGRALLRILDRVATRGRTGRQLKACNRIRPLVECLLVRRA